MTVLPNEIICTNVFIVKMLVQDKFNISARNKLTSKMSTNSKSEDSYKPNKLRTIKLDLEILSLYTGNLDSF